jgi:hypothetical protein
MAEYADKLYARRRGNAVATVSDSPINAVSGGRRRENSPDGRRRRSYGDRAMKCKPRCQWAPGNGSAAED